MFCLTTWLRFILTIMEESGSNHKEGWLYKRHSTFVAHKWKKLWFRLKDTQLHYGENEQVQEHRLQNRTK